MGAVDETILKKAATEVLSDPDFAASVERGVEDIKAGRTFKVPEGMTLSDYMKSEEFKNFMSPNAVWTAEENKHPNPGSNGTDAFVASSKDWPGFVAYGATSEDAITLGKQMASDYLKNKTS